MFIERVKFIEDELASIGATKFAREIARKKGQILRFKISDLGVSAALILKQEAISVGGDFIAPKDLILGENKRYCGILVATEQQIERLIKKCQIQPFGLKKVGEILREHLDSARGNSVLGMQFRTCENFQASTDSSLVDSPKISTNTKATPQSLPLRFCESQNLGENSEKNAESTSICHSERSEESQKKLQNRDSSVASLPQNDNVEVQNDNLEVEFLCPTQDYGSIALSQNQITYSKYPAFTYITTNKINTTLYIGVTSNLQKRIYEHKNHLIDGFSNKYNCEKLVYFESFDNIEQAIEREKYLKGKKRDFKENLINSINPQWLDLYQYLFESYSTNCHFEHCERGNPLLCHSEHLFCHSERSEESQKKNTRDSSVASLPQNDNLEVQNDNLKQSQNNNLRESTESTLDSADSQNLNAKHHKTPQIMGIINITDDSFYAESRTQNIDEILRKIEAMIAQGVEIIDIGAASTRPDSAEVEAEVELARLKEPLQAIFSAGLTQKAIFSLDSYNFKCAEFALTRGFQIINDVYGLRDIRLAELAKNSDKKIVLMHNSWLFPHSQDIVRSVDEFFSQKLEMLEKMGIKREQIILDVGFGFGKNSAENLRLTQNLRHFKHFGCEILMGASMKRTIGEVTSKDTDGRLFGTLALHQIALDNGADIIRCHDFSAHIDMLKMWMALNGRF